MAVGSVSPSASSACRPLPGAVSFSWARGGGFGLSQQSLCCARRPPEVARGAGLRHGDVALACAEHGRATQRSTQTDRREIRARPRAFVAEVRRRGGGARCFSVDTGRC